MSSSGIADPANHIEAGEASAAAITSILASAGLRIDNFDSILDFGCGSGRVIRQWLNLEADLFGCDRNAAAVSWCAENLAFADFEVNEVAPPTPFPGDRFDFVYALSVFTHLPADLQDPWIEEIHRILAPSGHLLLTAQGESFREHLPAGDAERFDHGELVVHFPRSAGTNMCAAYHPMTFVESLLRGRFQLLQVIPAADRSPYPQDMYLARTV